jgi:hypothetical protein
MLFFCIDIKFDINEVPVFSSLMFLSEEINYSYIIILGTVDIKYCNANQKTAKVIIAKNIKHVYLLINTLVFKFKPNLIINYHDNEKSLISDKIQYKRAKHISLESQFRYHFPLIFKYDLDEVSRSLINKPKNCTKFAKACRLLTEIQDGLKTDTINDNPLVQRNQLKLIRYIFNDLYLIQFLIRDTKVLCEIKESSNHEVKYFKISDDPISEVYGYSKDFDKLDAQYIIYKTDSYILSTEKINKPDAYFPKFWILNKDTLIILKEPKRCLFIGHDAILNSDIPIKKRIIEKYLSGKDVISNLSRKSIKDEELRIINSDLSIDYDNILEEIFSLLKRLAKF